MLVQIVKVSCGCYGPQRLTLGVQNANQATGLSFIILSAEIHVLW